MNLLVTLRLVHAAGYVHRDVRWPNIMRRRDSTRRIVLCDLGYAVRVGTSAYVSGTLRCASPAVLRAACSGQQHVYSALDDVHSWARTCYLLANPACAELLDDIVPDEGAAVSVLPLLALCVVVIGLLSAIEP